MSLAGCRRGWLWQAIDDITGREGVAVRVFLTAVILAVAADCVNDRLTAQVCELHFLAVVWVRGYDFESRCRDERRHVGRRTAVPGQLPAAQGYKAFRGMEAGRPPHSARRTCSVAGAIRNAMCDRASAPSAGFKALAFTIRSA